MGTAFQYDRLLAGHFDQVTGRETILAGQGVLTRGTALGKITLALGTNAAGTNSGNATIGSIALANGAKIGAYSIICVKAQGGVGYFYEVTDPDGITLGHAVEGVHYEGPIHFTITAGNTPTVIFDEFTVNVIAGSGSLKKLVSSSVDGSQNIYAILAEEVDATSTAKGAIYKSGTFNEDALVFGSPDTADTHRAAARDLGIYFKEIHPEAS